MTGRTYAILEKIYNGEIVEEIRERKGIIQITLRNKVLGIIAEGDFGFEEADRLILEYLENKGLSPSSHAIAFAIHNFVIGNKTARHYQFKLGNIPGVASMIKYYPPWLRPINSNEIRFRCFNVVSEVVPPTYCQITQGLISFLAESLQQEQSEQAR